MTTKMVKKVFALFLVALMVCSLCACGNSESTTDDADDDDKPYVPGPAIDKVVSANYTSEFPYISLVNLNSFMSSEFTSVEYVASTGNAYRSPYWDYETEPILLGHNAVAITEDYVLYADGTVRSVESDEDWGVTGVIEIEQGDVNNHTRLIALRNDGTMFVQDEHDEHSDFYKAEEWTDIIAISASIVHLVGLKSDGTAVAAGDNHCGQCDVEHWTDIIAIGTANHNGYSATYGVKKDGTVVTTEEGYDVSAWTDIVAIAATDNFVMGLKDDGTVVTSGEDYNGETKTSGWTDIVAIQAYRGLSIGIKADGTVVSAGDDYVVSKYLKDVKIKVD